MSPLGLQITQLVLSLVVSVAPEKYSKGSFTLSLFGRSYGKDVGCFVLFLSYLRPEDFLVTVVGENRS